MYTVRAALSGFSDFEKLNVSVGAGPTAVDVTMALGGLTESITVDARLDPFHVMPSRETNSLFGLDKPIAEIPRSISVIEADHITRYDVRTVNDLVTVAPGSFTGSYFGVPGSLFVRGEPGDNFFRGFRRVENRGNYATPVAATDHIEIVKGPPSPIYGGGKIGGFLNFLPKTARTSSAKWMESPQGKATFTYGSYDQRIASGEIGVPFTVGGRRAGFYAFGEIENSNSFYNGIYSKSKVGQIAVDMELAPKWRVEFGGQGYSGQRPQNIGWNRVTQDLVDKKQYLAGTPLVNLSSNGTDLGVADLHDGALEQFAFTENMGAEFAPPRPLPSRPVCSSWIRPRCILVTLSHDQIFVDGGDFSDAFTMTAYFDLINEITAWADGEEPDVLRPDGSHEVQHLRLRRRLQALGDREQDQSRLDGQGRLGVSLQTSTGVAYRYSGVAAGESRGRGYQVIDRRDVSLGALANDRFQGPFNSNGQIPFNYFQDGSYGDTGCLPARRTSTSRRS